MGTYVDFYNQQQSYLVCPAVRLQCFAMLSLRARHTNLTMGMNAPLSDMSGERGECFRTEEASL